jgi:hypothetical protein
MSGKKRVYVDNAEYQRLLQDETKLRTMRQDLPEMLNTLARQNSSELQRQLGPLERRQQDFQKAMAQTNAEVRKIEEATARRLEVQQREMREALQASNERFRQELQNSEYQQQVKTTQMVGQLRTETKQLIIAQDHKFSGLLEQERNIREQQIEKIEQQFSYIQDAEQRKREMAQSWIDASKILDNFMQVHYRHEQFGPGRLADIQRTLQRAMSNLAQNAAEAALSQAQQAYDQFSNFRLELESLESEWRLWRCAALDATRELLELTHQNRTVEALDAQLQTIMDGDKAYEIEVDWWTQGKLSKAEAAMNKLLTQLEEDNLTLSISELQHITNKVVPDLQEQLEAAVQEARLNILGSQQRQNLAALVVDSLEMNGFLLQHSTYEGDDMRLRYAAKVQDIGNSELVVLVSPTEGIAGRNELELEDFGLANGGSEYEAWQRATELQRILKARGYQMGDFKCEELPASQETFDWEDFKVHPAPLPENSELQQKGSASFRQASK